MTRTARLLATLPLVLATACTSEAFNNAIWAQARALVTQPEYVIGNSDMINIRVLGEPEYVIEEKVVRPDGKVEFPGYGDIEVVGKTPQALREELERSFASPPLGMKNPRVFVNVESYESKSVTVLGEVRVPGRFPYTGQMRVVDLLGRTIGWDPITASRSRILLFRDIEGEVKMYHVNVYDMFYKGDFTTNFYLRPGDVLWVPPTGFEEIARAIRKVLSPITAVANAIGLGTSTAAYFVPVAN